MKALVVSGGGCKGAFAVGAVSRILHRFPTLDFDVFVGTSAGSLVNTLASIGEYNLLRNLYSNTSTVDILDRFNIGDRINHYSVYDSAKAWNLINHHFSDTRYDQLLQSGKVVLMTTVCLQDGKMVVFATNKNAVTGNKNYEVQQIQSGDHYRKALMASISVPIFMPPVKVNLHYDQTQLRNNQYVDGGVLEWAGVQVAIDAGADEIFTILLSPGDVETTTLQFTRLLPVLERTIELMVSDVGKSDLIIPQIYNEALDYINSVKEKMVRDGVSQNAVDEYFTIDNNVRFSNKKKIIIHIIKPSSHLGGGPGGLYFVPKEMREMISKGEVAVDNYFS